MDAGETDGTLDVMVAAVPGKANQGVMFVKDISSDCTGGTLLRQVFGVLGSPQD